MIFRMTERFRRAYKKLDSTKQSNIKKAILKMESNHPSLRVKHIKGTADIREASADMKLRLTFSRDNQVITLRNCGEHDQTLKKP